MKQHKPVKFAVVGLGHIGKRHAALIHQNKNAILQAVCDILPAKTTQFSLTNIPYYTNLKDLLENEPQTDVVTIATPNGLHASQCNEVLKHNRHVVCEKPMALHRTDCENVIHTALQKNKQVFLVMQNRYSPPAKLLKHIISENILGEIFVVNINCFWNRGNEYYQKSTWKGTAELDGGVLFTQFSHFIDIMYWLFGDITNIKSHIVNFNHKNVTDFGDSGTIMFEFLKGGIGNLNFSTALWNQNMESSITIIGENGTIKVGGQYMDKITYCHIKNFTLPKLEPTATANNYGKYKGSANNHIHIINNVMEVLNNKDTVTTNALEGMKVVDIIERMYNSLC